MGERRQRLGGVTPPVAERRYRTAIVGATGAVGEELLRVLEKREFPVASLKLLASPRSAGKRLRFEGEDLPVEEARPEAFRDVEVAFFSAGASVSRQLCPIAAERALVVDNSSAFRMDPQVPLVVPEVNPQAAAGKTTGIIANPNCTTIVALLAVAPLHRAVGVERFTAASYQAASGAGAQAMAELEAQARAWARGEPVPPPKALPQRLLWNVFPQVDVFLEDGYTKEEMKMVHETRKILRAPEMRVSATCVRVPVLRAHSVALHLEMREAVTPARAREILAAAKGVIVEDDPSQKRYPMPLFTAGTDEVRVGRIRQDCSHERGLALFCVGDQLLKGAALNAVQVAECALGMGGWFHRVG